MGRSTWSCNYEEVVGHKKKTRMNERGSVYRISYVDQTKDFDRLDGTIPNVMIIIFENGLQRLIVTHFWIHLNSVGIFVAEPGAS